MARPRRLPKVLSPEEQQRLLTQLNPRYYSPHRDRVMFRLMLATGLRVGEAVALRPEHVRFDASGGRIIVREGKGAKDRIVYFGPRLRDELREWMEHRPESRFLFPSCKGTKLRCSQVRRRIKQLAEKADVAEWKKVSPHTLRHTFATELYRQTKDLRLVQEALGHAHISTTQVYTHLVNGELESAMRTFEPELGAA